MQNIVVIGSGFIGLEAAAAATELGKNVKVIESQTRFMARAVPVPISNVSLLFQKEKLIGVTSINRPVEHLAAKKLLQAGTSPMLEQVGNVECELPYPYPKGIGASPTKQVLLNYFSVERVEPNPVISYI